MPSQGVLDRERAGRAVIAAVRTHAPEVGQRVHKILAAGLKDGETLPDVPLLLLLASRLLQSRIDALVEVDRQALVERFKHQEPRRRRDSAAEAVYSHLVQLRGVLDVTFGRGSAGALVGLTGEMPTDPCRLVRLGKRVLAALRRLLADGLPQPRHPGIGLDLEPCADRLQRDVARLDQALAEVGRNKKEAAATVFLKNAAVEACDGTARALVSMMRGWYELAGLPRLADRLRFSLNPRRERSERTKGG